MAAGLGFKTFTTGEVLTAADTNGYLMQGVLVFASAAARDAAITSPQEGQCCYLKDTDAVLTYSGAAWVGFDDSNAVQNSIVDAKGDLIAASAADTPARLAVGNNGEQIVADSSATSGLRYTAGTVQANPVLNSAFQVWQRGTSFTTSAQYTADRWYGVFDTGIAATFTRQTTNDTTNLPNIQYCIRAQRDSGNTGAAPKEMYVAQSFESVNSIPYAGKTVTFSFYARAGANYSPTSSLLVASLYSGTGTDQNVMTSYTGSVVAATTSATLTTTWQRFSVSGTIATTAKELAMNFMFKPTGTAGAADYFEVTGVQLDIGSVALPFRTYAATIQGELAACQRYYYRHATGTSLKSIALGAYVAGSQFEVVLKLPVSMRTTPTIDQVTGTDYYINDGNSDGYNSLTIDYATENSVAMYNNAQVTGTTGQCFSTKLNNASAYLGFSSEL